jgi:hypothetical protein
MVIPLRPRHRRRFSRRYNQKNAMAAASEVEEVAAVLLPTDWETKHRNPDWLENNLNDIYRNTCESVSSSASMIPADLETKHFVFLVELRDKLVAMMMINYQGTSQSCLCVCVCLFSDV